MVDRTAASIEDFRLDIPQTALDDLRERLSRTRWPERETVDGRTQGVPLADAQALCEYWRDHYDWRRCERKLNELGQFRTTIDGLGIHFLHVRSSEPNALPLILTHGWPGSIVEFLDVIDPLVDPVRHGGRAEDAFHVVIPSLPGYGFSDRPAERGWSVERVAAAWIELMNRLGYGQFVAQGGDWGSAVTNALAKAAPPALIGIHLNLVFAMPAAEDMSTLTAEEQQYLAGLQAYANDARGYFIEQSTRPQTVGYGLTDSPAGQATWIFEKLCDWSDTEGDPVSALGYDRILDNIMLYWLPATAASSARLYWESSDSLTADPLGLPVACSIFPKETVRPTRKWAERVYPRLVHWGEPARGGHFAAFEQPEIFVNELRLAFSAVRDSAGVSR